MRWEGARQVDLYLNTEWIKGYENAYIAEAIAWSENGDHAAIYTTDSTGQGANDRLMGALYEPNLTPEKSVKDE
jgi:hypothetical protein